MASCIPRRWALDGGWGASLGPSFQRALDCACSSGMPAAAGAARGGEAAPGPGSSSGDVMAGLTAPQRRAAHFATPAALRGIIQKAAAIAAGHNGWQARARGAPQWLL